MDDDYEKSGRGVHQKSLIRRFGPLGVMESEASCINATIFCHRCNNTFCWVGPLKHYGEIYVKTNNGSVAAVLLEQYSTLVKKIGKILRTFATKSEAKSSFDENFDQNKSFLRFSRQFVAITSRKLWLMIWQHGCNNQPSLPTNPSNLLLTYLLENRKNILRWAVRWHKMVKCKMYSDGKPCLPPSLLQRFLI